MWTASRGGNTIKSVPVMNIPSKQTETGAERQTRPANKQAAFTGRDPEQINPEARRQNLIKLLFESSDFVFFAINPHDSNLAMLIIKKMSKVRSFIYK